MSPLLINPDPDFVRHSTTQKGFTLVEIIIYIAIISIFFLSIVQFADSAIRSSERARTLYEVRHNARFAIERIKREIRYAEDVNIGSSTFGSHPGVLTLASFTPANDPTVIDLDGNERLQITLGAGSPYFLTTDDVIVTDLQFFDRSVSGRTKNIQVLITVEHANASSVEFDASVTLRTTVVILTEEEI